MFSSLFFFLLLLHYPAPPPSPPHQTLAAYLVITTAPRNPFHLKDWQLSQWNTIKWLPLKRKGKFELWYAAACRTASLLKWKQRWRSCKGGGVFSLSPLCLSSLAGQILDNQRRCRGKQKGSSGGAFIFQRHLILHSENMNSNS